MTLNNLGAAQMSLGDFDAARQALQSARELDPLAPLPYFNLAMIEDAEGNAEQSARLLQQARDLGFKGSMSDRFIGRTGELVARAEGHGAKRSA
jgi:Flp pilus assembly protein TadD